MTPLELAREYLPNATDGELGFVLWNFTGFPGFFSGDPETELRRQLAAYAADPEGVAARQEAEMAAILGRPMPDET